MDENVSVSNPVVLMKCHHCDNRVKITLTSSTIEVPDKWSLYLAPLGYALVCSCKGAVNTDYRVP